MLALARGHHGSMSSAAQRWLRPVIVLVALLAVLTNGCYFGRSPGAKGSAYFANGAAIAIGGLLVLSDTDRSQPSECGADGCHDFGGGGVAVGLPLLAVGVLGVVLNLAVPTRRPAPAHRARAAAVP